MKIETQLIYFEDWVLRVRPPTGQGKRILLMLHGWLGDENAMWIFAHKLPADAWIVAPRAPHPAPQGGYSWRAPAPGPATVDSLRPSAAALLDLLDTWPRANTSTSSVHRTSTSSVHCSLDGSSVDVVGFSQGAAMAFVLALLHPARVRKMAVLAGFAPEGAEQLLAPGQFNGKKLFVAHGAIDETIPIAQARRTVQLMEQAGAQVVYCESNVGHKLGADCVRALGVYLS